MEDDHNYQPFAWKEASKRWPELAQAVWPDYKNGRLVLRPDDADPYKK